MSIDNSSFTTVFIACILSGGGGVTNQILFVLITPGGFTTMVANEGLEKAEPI